MSSRLESYSRSIYRQARRRALGRRSLSSTKSAKHAGCGTSALLGRCRSESQTTLHFVPLLPPAPPPPPWRGRAAEETYLRTGDRCHIGADGLLHVEGRIKDLIIINGRNIYPQASSARESRLSHRRRRRSRSQTAAMCIRSPGNDRPSLIGCFRPTDVCPTLVKHRMLCP